ncbi:hypothetical protein COY87_02905, partial [Candidatus Roizmanbacteria bacterium CG_4_10_14_0_8_um_filter_33_9]
MFYPKNFPKKLEKDLVILLLYIQNKTKTELTSKNLVQYIHQYLKTSNKTIFNGSVPSYWWLQFILYRHKKKFSADFVDLIRPLLTKTKTRSLSGIIPLSLFTKGVGCPFNCAYCPNEPGIPKSYLSDEPAVMRALRHKFDPFKQTQSRLIMFCLSNHPLDKVEIIIKGGTFSFYSKQYRIRFMKRIFHACNTNIQNLIMTGNNQKEKSLDFNEEQKQNEKALSRIIGINIETRPDYINQSELRYLRKLGITHVEIGVQALDNDIYTLIRRGHTIQSVINATQQLKDAGFKVGYHLMLNLPGSDTHKDFVLLKKAFENDLFKPDHLKLYPTAITPFTDISKWYKEGIYKPYSLSEMIKTIIAFKKNVVPEWTRIGRLTRDITTTMMENKQFPPNLRELIQKEMSAENIACKCIRCREIKDTQIQGKIKMRIIKYQASGGIEYFLEYVDEENHSLGFLRLRIPSYITNKKIKPMFSVLKNASIVRELHVYGQSTEIGSKTKKNIQHKSLGEKLLKKAEKITQKQGLTKIV